MERIKVNKPTIIFCSDLHFREDTPTCWTGDFQKEQWDSIDYISKLQQRWNIPVVSAGDILHVWKSSPWLLSMIMKHIPAKFFSCIGQHDLPQHSLSLLDKSGFGTLRESGYIKTAEDWDLDIDIHFCHWGEEPKIDLDKRRKHILVWHHLTYLTKPFPGAEGGMAEGLLRKYSMYDLICTGDCHQSFTVEYQGRRLVNPGNLTRQTADQADFQPRVALWYSEDNSIEWVNLPIQKDVISREHLAVKEERDARIDAFVSSLDGDYKTEMSFEQNLESFFQVNTVRDSVKNIIYRSLD